jgi:ribosomal protein S27AE
MRRKLARFVESYQSVKYMGGYDHALVHCPRCDGMAVRRKARVTCGTCAYTSELRPKPKEVKSEPPQVVMCPECNRYVGTYRSDLRVLRLRCRGCGWVKEPTVSDSWGKPKRQKWARLWLEVDFRGERLWAVNEEHLDFLESYVAAGVRETSPFNSTIASRLPAWIKSGKNREDLLRALAKLRTRLPENTPPTR